MVHELSGVDVCAISIVDKGANRRRFFLRKAEGEGADTAVEIESRRIVKADDWSCVYCVVAEPGALEGPGIGAAEPDIDDRWSEDEIRKAAHRFMKNGGLVNRMHEDLEPYGQLVENAVALADFEVDGETISKGSWYVAIAPNAEGRQAIEDGVFAGVSIQGTATRTLVDKKSDDDHAALDEVLLSKPKTEGGTCSLTKATGAALPGLDRKPGTSNWVDATGGLPSLIDRAARHLHAERGRTISAAIATAVNWAKKMCASGTAFGGKVKVSAKAQAAACAAVAEWEAKKAKAKVTKQKVRKGEVVWETEEGSSAYLRSVGDVNEGLLKRIAKAVGISEEELIEEVEKGQPTFAQRMAERDLDEELPQAMDVLRSAIWRAFYPDPDQTDTDPKSLVEQNLDEFKAWALDLIERVPVTKIAEQIEDAEAEFDPDLELVDDNGEPLSKAKVRSYQRVVNGRSITVRAYDRGGGTGGLARRLKTLNTGARAVLPDGIKVKRRKNGFGIETPQGEPDVTATPTTETEAARAVVEASLRATHPKSLGGKRKFNSLTQYRSSRLSKPQAKKPVKKSEGSSADPANVDDMSETDLAERIEKIEETLAELTPEKIAKAVAEAAKEPEAPTPEELQESVTKLTEAVTKVADDVQKLGEGGTSQAATNGNEPQPVAKADRGILFDYES